MLNPGCNLCILKRSGSALPSPAALRAGAAAAPEQRSAHVYECVCGARVCARWGRARRAAGRQMRSARRRGPGVLLQSRWKRRESCSPSCALGPTPRPPRARPLGYSTLLLLLPPPTPPGNASSLLQLSPAPPSPLAAKGYPAADDRRPPPWFSPHGGPQEQPLGRAGYGSLCLRDCGGRPWTRTLSQPLLASIPLGLSRLG
jgi:hypothetical protein